jgi:hypothetical protein
VVRLRTRKLVGANGDSPRLSWRGASFAPLWRGVRRLKAGPGRLGQPTGGNNVTIVGILVVIILVLLVIYLFQRVR